MSRGFPGPISVTVFAMAPVIYAFWPQIKESPEGKYVLGKIAAFRNARQDYQQSLIDDSHEVSKAFNKARDVDVDFSNVFKDIDNKGAPKSGSNDN